MSTEYSARVWLMTDDEENDYILVDDHPMPPVGAKALGNFQGASAWSHACDLADQISQNLKLPVELYNEEMNSFLSSDGVL